jgi:hypothetical protein
MSLTITNESTTKAQALSNLKVIANKDLINYETGITAKINSEQRNKILSNAAVIKSLKNGFTSAQHNSVAAEIEKFWYHAKLVKSRSDRANDINIVSIKHFETPVFFEKSEGTAYFTLKETLNDGHRIYSLELRKIRSQGGTPKERTTTGINSLSPESAEKSSGLSGGDETLFQLGYHGTPVNRLTA